MGRHYVLDPDLTVDAEGHDALHHVALCHDADQIAAIVRYECTRDLPLDHALYHLVRPLPGRASEEIRDHDALQVLAVGECLGTL
jgi:hypothetical protein